MRKTALIAAAICVVAAATFTLARHAVGQRVVPIIREDCIPYDPETLAIRDEGEKGWMLTSNDGSHWMALLDNEQDAEAALALARRHKALCFIGRGNRRPKRRDYIVNYWK